MYVVNWIHILKSNLVRISASGVFDEKKQKKKIKSVIEKVASIGAIPLRNMMSNLQWASDLATDQIHHRLMLIFLLLHPFRFARELSL